jgi:cardiolipin synthase
MTRTFLQTWVAFKQPDLQVAGYLCAPVAEKNGALIIPYADSPLDEVYTSEAVYLQMISRAEKYLYIATPYLVLDEGIRTALCLAAARGVDVRIITPGIPDKKAVYRLTRANYGALLRAGVRIYEYTPGFLHAKITLADGCAAVGTTNYDYRSLYLHFENMIYFQDEACAKKIEEDFSQMLLVSKERTLANTKRSFLGRVFDTVLRIFEPLL